MSYQNIICSNLKFIPNFPQIEKYLSTKISKRLRKAVLSKLCLSLPLYVYQLISIINACIFHGLTNDVINEEFIYSLSVCFTLQPTNNNESILTALITGLIKLYKRYLKYSPFIHKAVLCGVKPLLAAAAQCNVM